MAAISPRKRAEVMGSVHSNPITEPGKQADAFSLNSATHPESLL
jgi:hypothetical protein